MVNNLTKEIINNMRTTIETTNMPINRISLFCRISKQAYDTWMHIGQSLVEEQQYSDETKNGKLDESILTDHEKLCVQLYKTLKHADTIRQNKILHNYIIKSSDLRALQWLSKVNSE